MSDDAPKRPRGRPSKFSEALAKRILDMTIAGETDAAIAKAAGIALSVFKTWKNSKEDFQAALKDAKDVADSFVEASLYQRACGYKHKEYRAAYNALQDKWSTMVYVKHYAPDVTACIFWLKNRRPDIWRDAHIALLERAQEFRETKAVDDEMAKKTDAELMALIGGGS